MNFELISKCVVKNLSLSCGVSGKGLKSKNEGLGEGLGDSMGVLGFGAGAVSGAAFA